MRIKSKKRKAGMLPWKQYSAGNCSGPKIFRIFWVSEHGFDYFMAMCNKLAQSIAQGMPNVLPFVGGAIVDCPGERYGAQKVEITNAKKVIQRIESKFVKGLSSFTILKLQTKTPDPDIAQALNNIAVSLMQTQKPTGVEVGQDEVLTIASGNIAGVKVRVYDDKATFLDFHGPSKNRSYYDVQDASLIVDANGEMLAVPSNGQRAAD